MLGFLFACAYRPACKPLICVNSMSQWSANINVMMNAARRAGRSLMRDFKEVDKLQVSRKGPGDFVSRADKRAEEILLEELSTARSNYGFLGEEGTNVDGNDPTRRWIVDPLDGTMNFIHGQPHWAISIALEHKGQIVAGVVLCPPSDEIFVAEKGGGAWLNDQRIRVSARRKIADMMFNTGIPSTGRPGLPDQLRQMAYIAPVCASVRSLGGQRT